MNRFSYRRRKRLGGISAKTIALPLAVVIALLQIAIVGLSAQANRQNEKLAQTMNDYGEYESEATRLVSGASVLYGTATTYVGQADKTNVGALIGYANEIRNYPERRPDAIAAKFAEYDVGSAPKGMIRDAQDAANTMLGIQTHAIALVWSVYPSDHPLLAGFEIPTPEEYGEGALTNEEKIAKAEFLLTDSNSSYAAMMGTVSSAVSRCVDLLREEADGKIMETMAVVRTLRVVLLVTTAALSLLLLSFFFVIYVWLVSPLTKFVRGIATDRPLDEKTGLYEVRRLANSYNALLRRRESLETVLRFAAETDQLTNLPNRYRFEQYFYESGKSGYPVAFLVFDVNHLKETNDKKGHLAGDELIRCAAECICECFGAPGENNCFRIGGDEFAAIVKRVPKDEIERRLVWFSERQKENEVSVAVGLAYAEEIGDTNFRDMFLTADRNMYSDKMREHSERKKSKNDA